MKNLKFALSLLFFAMSICSSFAEDLVLNQVYLDVEVDGAGGGGDKNKKKKDNKDKMEMPTYPPPPAFPRREGDETIVVVQVSELEYAIGFFEDYSNVEILLQNEDYEILAEYFIEEVYANDVITVTASESGAVELIINSMDGSLEYVEELY